MRLRRACAPAFWRAGTALLLLTPLLSPIAPAGSALAAPPAAPSRPTRACPATAADRAAAVVAARLCGGRVGVAAATTDTDLLWANPNATFTLEHHYRPVRVRRGDTWAAADPTLATAPDGSIRPRAAAVDLRLAPGGRDLLSITSHGHTVTVGSPLGRLPRPSLRGPTATYAGVLPGVDLAVTADVEGYSEQLVVHDAAAAANPRLSEIAFPVHAAGARLSAAGNLRVLDAAGRPLFASSAPRMWAADADAAGPPGPARRRAAGVGLSVAGGTVRLRPDLGILRSPATRFPLVIDPGITEARLNWTWVDSGSPTSSFWNSTDDARVGSSDSGASVRRSFFQMAVTSLGGAHIDSATFDINEVWAWSCTPEPVELWETGGISTTTTWRGQPSWLARQSTVSVAKGWSPSGEGGASSCPAGKVSFNATSAVRDAVRNNWPNLTLGLRSPSETNNLYWKRFSNNPTLSVTYNLPPAAPTQLAVTPSTGGYTSSLQGVLSARVTSPDGAPLAVQYEVWNADLSVDVCFVHPTTPDVASGSIASWQMNTPRADGTLYHLRVRSYDGVSFSPWSPYLDFTTDATAPASAPTVTSTDYPQGAWARGAGQDGTFDLGAAGVGDVSSYRYGLDEDPPTETEPAATLGGTASVTLTPATAGPHTLYVRSVDRAGNQSPSTAYSFFAGSAAVTSPSYGDAVAGSTSLQGMAPPGTTGVTFQWRRADTDAWAAVPTADATLATGGAVSWPLAAAGSNYPKVNWDVRATLARAAGGAALAGPVQTRAVFSGGSGGISPPVLFTFDLDRATAATAPAGPGAVNLVTGALTLDHVDVPTGAIGLTRTYNTRLAGVADPMFGPGWTSSVTADTSSTPYSGLTVTGSLAQLRRTDGESVGFTTHSADAGGATFTPQADQSTLALAYTAGTYTYTLTDSTDQSVVTFTHPAGAATGTYTVASLATAGASQKTTLSWQNATVDGHAVAQPTRLLAAAPAGVSCASLVRGCRALTFSYAASTTATDTAFGDYAGRLAAVSFTAWDPDASPPTMRTVPIAAYAYDPAGRLRQEWDPRLDYHDAAGTHHAAERYDYGGDGVLSALTPSGQEPWRFAYTAVPGDAAAGRLASVTRSALAAGAATTSVVYAVPVTGAGAPYDLSAGQTSRWGQAEAPVRASAVFDPGQVPDGNPAAGTPPTSWTRATVFYLDANGRQVDLASPGGAIGATWYDLWGNTARTLTGSNRATALDRSPTDAAADEAASAAALSTMDVYTADGTERTETFGPAHDVRLSTGSVVRGRDHTSTRYDEGAPAGGPYRLATSETKTVAWWDANGAQHDTDPETTATGYDWTLRQATTSTVDPGGLALTTRTAYDTATGRVLSQTTPAGGASVTTPATELTTYYSAAANSVQPDCGSHPEWDGLICRVGRGGQPTAGPEIPARTFTYDMYQQTRTAVDRTSTAVLRTTTTGYDGAGRVSTVAVTGLGTQVPTARTTYDPLAGTPVRTQLLDGSGTVTAEIQRGYDTLGRITSYTDAAGAVTTTTYDLFSRVASTTDANATRSYGYDGAGESRGLRTSVTDSRAGTFTAGYDAAGNPVSQSWPDGISVTQGYDETGTATSISYRQAGCAAADCTLFAEQVVPDAHGRIGAQASTLSTQVFGYDAAHRLVRVQDAAGGQCVTRGYTFNAASDRTGLTSYGPATDGSCQTAAAATSRTWSYDAADRASGYGYDALGRATTAPAADTRAPAAGAETINYFGNDMVASLGQGGATVTYALDPLRNRVAGWTDAGGTGVNHYGDDSDSPSWTAEPDSSWTRVVADVIGTAALDSSAGLQWQLADLSGTLVAGLPGGGVGLAYTSSYDEYGMAGGPGDGGIQRYGWEGALQRAADTPGGVVLMGARAYLPGSGAFTSTDPVPGGSDNAYGYCAGDPVNCSDTSGQDQHCKRVWFIKLCSVINNWGPSKIRIQRDASCAWGHFWCHPSGPIAWLRPYRSSRSFWADTDYFRAYGHWIRVYSGQTYNVAVWWS